MTLPVTALSPSLDPFVIELFWDGSKSGDEGIIAGNEGKEYPGDSSNGVTLTKAELDGVDVLDTSVSQSANSFRLSISDISLGDHTLKYNAEDALGNTNATDRVLRFTVQAVPTWEPRAQRRHEPDIAALQPS